MTPRFLMALATADFRDRVRRPAFLMTALATVALGYLAAPPASANYAVVKVGAFRGVYDSSYLGAVLALGGGLWLSLCGFYVVKNAIAKDATTSVGQILAAAPMRTIAYLLGKFLSNLALLGALAGVLALTALGMLFLRGESPTVDLLALWLPFLLLCLPLLAVSAAAAVLFESTPVLRGGAGNIIWCFGFLTVFVAGLGATGLRAVGASLQADLRGQHPEATATEISVGLTTEDDRLGTFQWSGLDVTGELAAWQLGWLVLALLIAALPALWFTRFDPARRRQPARPTQVVEPAMSTVAIAPGTRPVVRFTRATTPALRGNPVPGMVAGELRLLLKGRSRWWWLGLAGITVAGLAAPAGSGPVLLLAWIWPVLLWSRLGTQAVEHGVHVLTGAGPGPRQRLLSEWVAGVAVAALSGAGPLLRMLFSGDLPGSAAWLGGPDGRRRDARRGAARPAVAAPAPLTSASRSAAVTGAPAARVPVPAGGLPRRPADRLQRPHHQVWHAGPDLLVAPGTAVGLHRRAARDLPHPPLLRPPALDGVHATADLLRVERGRLVRAWPAGAARPVAARAHAASVRSAGVTSAVPYGEWASPITAADLTAATRRLGFPALVGDEIWWAEDRPDEGGRTTVMARRADGAIVELLPAPWCARSRVHEYGGRAFLAVPGPAGTALVFASFTDQRLYRLDPGADPPVPLTPRQASYAALRYADLVLSPDAGEIWCVRERHHDGDLDRQIVAVPTDGRGARDPAAIREVVGGSRFIANPRLSPDGTRLAWLAWDHPNMPWDGTELRVGTLEDGRVGAWSAVLGGPTESVLQPEWDGDDHLLAVSDRSGWWNLHRVPAPGVAGSVRALCPRAEEFGAPLWQLGAATWGRLRDGRLLCVHGTGSQRLGVLDPASGELTDLDLPYQTYTASLAVDGDRAVVVAGAPTSPSAVVAVDVAKETAEAVRPAVDPASLPDPAWLPVPEDATFTGPGGRDVHAYVYPPRNPDHTGPPSARPPYVVFVHGGPTSHSPATLDLAKAYFTSRGIGVLDVNYGGSTGYGRAYRQRLVRAWGVVDVEDVAAAAAALVARGDADPARLAIRGGSAGGWTTLCAVTGTSGFAAGTSIFGVADARRLAATTHDFEARYVQALVGDEDVFDERSPLPRARQTRCPVLLLQGSDDPIVPREQAEQFRDALAAAGVRHALLVFPGEHHGFRKATSIVAAAEAELSFYGQVMGFEPPGIPALALTSATQTS